MLLTDLPEELLHLIITQCICEVPEDYAASFAGLYNDNLKILNRLCLTSRRLESTARGLLYHTFVKPENLHSTRRRWYGIGQISDNVVLRRFLRTLIQRPDLRKHVKRLVLLRWKDHLTRHHQVSSRLSAQDERDFKQILSQALEQYHLKDGVDRAWKNALLADHWTPPTLDGAQSKRYPNYCEDAEVALLLLLVPNIDTLEIDIPGKASIEPSSDIRAYPYEPFFRFTLRSILAGDLGPTHFSNLRRFHSLRRMYYQQQVIELPTLSEILSIPSLQTFTGFLTATEVDGGSRPFWPAAQSTIHTLKLDAEHVPIDVLEGLLNGIAQLKSFSITYTHENIVDLVFGMDDWSAVRRALSAHSSSLEELKLDIETPPPEKTRGASSWPLLIDTLLSFERLQKVEIHQSAFLNLDLATNGSRSRRPLAEVLPPSIQELTVLCFDSGLFSQLDAFVAMIPTAYPVLQKLEVKLGDFCHFDQNRAYPPHNLVRSAEGHLDRVIAKLDKIGVEFVERA
ncbi:hypothetical protein MBLNU457_7208t1 [Dothideomycetes sp. NU457]